MATITTTIREPKTFQQIQDQQNELGKNQTLESLNDNISKLIKAITDRDQKRETEQDRQLRMNQLELSKLQLRRAQLGLAKDEKYYSDYSRKWSEKNNFGTSMGLDKNTSGNLGAIGVSALTVGTLNPVVVKQLLFPIMTPLMNVTKALATFPGLLPGLFRKSSGKSSSAIASDPDRKLHGKLDQILGAIKDKARGNKKEKEEQEGLLSKLLKMLILGTAGLTLASAVLGGEEGLVKNTLIEHGKAMLAGFVLGGWKGALVGLALDVFAKTTGIIPKETDKPTIIDVAADNARQKIEEWANIKISDTEFKLAVAGMMIAGPKGMLAGYILGNEKVQEAIRAFRTDGFEGLKDLTDRTILKMAKDTPLEGIPVDVIEGAIAGAAAGSTFGIKGFVSGAILGAAGGFAWDRYKNATIPEASGINTNFDFSKGDFVISGTDKTYSDFLEPLLLEEIKDKDGNTKLKYTREQAEKLAIERIKQYLKENKIDNKKQTITETIWNTAKENPVEALATAGGIALLTSTTATTLLSDTIRSLGKTARGLIQTSGAGSQLASLVTGLVLLWVAKGLYNANGEVDKEYNEELFKEENKGKQASEILNEIRNRAIENGEISKAVMASVQGLGANVAEFFHPDKEKLLEIKRTTLKYNRDFHQSGQKYIFGQDEFEKYKESAVDYLGSLIGHDDLLAKTDREGTFTGNKIWIDERFLPLLESIGFNPKDIQKYNEIENKNPKEVTKEEKLFQENLLDKIGKVSKDDKGVFIINSQNEEKINKQEKKQKEEENQCLTNNTDQLSTLNQTLQDVNETLKKQTPIQWVEGQPQPVYEYTPIANGNQKN